jgi:hypothetical protein
MLFSLPRGRFLKETRLYTLVFKYIQKIRQTKKLELIRE